MRVKLYKGPMHGKVYNIDPALLLRGVQVVKNVDVGHWLAEPELTASFDTLTYRAKLMSVCIDGITYRAPAMHPDGSVFLEYSK